MLEKIVLSFIAFALFLVVHWVVFHFWRITNRFRVVNRIFLVFLFGYMAAALLIPDGSWYGGVVTETDVGRLLTYVNGLAIYIFLFFSYAQFYFLIDRGISARILTEIEETPAKELSFAELTSRYVPNQLLTRRLEDMRYGGYLIEENGRWRMTSKGRFNAVVFRFFKYFLRLYPGG
ncbi:MAG: hypothetical protein A2942_00315 [Candidatus Lloydbacteria bacterium RIFCSPLOWO2_01_FULL_50_20]|uniref:Uncharacterized protein n=1 Tax=Candidatus Lloydbacteria bacterium RIFCSPLOWO2_01_FULL_50_20 TaxID=1798665 RepID=A0A1G2DGJ3_9BACT|nr:MAG: hypothetical protein A3C13_04215 [Candidatus Lloydbacteria bacterium RIFCSPHIGHO2_02_FULL_50_11]OGZ12542.1 MAG: hypothetical protein A2942_00315 [Candidatus Lloydbacteria bacterium RIFCSPLOWO2_01_FULL_50_20]